MNKTASILVATSVRDDAELVRKMLGAEFTNVVCSIDEDKAVSDFEKHRPAVLILAFDTLEKAERYYLGLYRLSPLVHALPHRTLILCNKEDLRRVYELCKKEYFHDYMLFWPMTHDAPRLLMAVHHALRHLAAAGASGPTVKEFAALARRLAESDAMLAQQTSLGKARLDDASRSLGQVRSGITDALDRFASQLEQGEMKGLVDILDGPGLRSAMERFRAAEIAPHLDAAASAVLPVRAWVGGLKETMAPRLKAARDLQTLVEQVRSLVLVVDDDEFQHKVLRNLLQSANLDLAFATTGTEALVIAGRRRPDLILMDVELPDINGVEVTRRIRSIPEFAGIPIFMITGHGDKTLVVNSIKAGASGFVLKPFNRDGLLAKVHGSLQRGDSAPTQQAAS